MGSLCVLPSESLPVGREMVGGWPWKDVESMAWISDENQWDYRTSPKWKRSRVIHRHWTQRFVGSDPEYIEMFFFRIFCLLHVTVRQTHAEKCWRMKRRRRRKGKEVRKGREGELQRGQRGGILSHGVDVHPWERGRRERERERERRGGEEGN